MAFECFSKKVVKILLWIVLPILVLSIVMLAMFPTIYKAVLKKEITLDKGTLASEIWKDIPIPIYERLYFFNITNKDAFIKGKEPLSVAEVGPYTYKSRWVKKDPEWHSDSTVSYKEIRTYHFVPDLSNGTEDDEIYTLNGPMIIATSIVKDYDVKMKTLFSILLGIFGEDVIIKKSIRQLAYDGYEDIIIKVAPLLKPDIPFKDGIFSWLYGKNATDDGLFTVFTGSDDPSRTNFIKKWNGKEKLSFWKGDECNCLNGTSIEIGPPIHKDQESYSFFQSIFCRSLTYNYTEDKTYFDILAKRFRPTHSLFANKTENPDNYCFEMGNEYPSGVLDISTCQFGAPVFISFPHFYMADPSFLTSVNGMDPSDEKHGSALDVETITGISIGAKLRFQINVELSKIEGIVQTYNVRNGIFPLLWVEISLEIDESLANYLKAKTRNPKIIAYSVFGILTGVCTVTAIALIVILCLRNPDDDDDPLLDAAQKESHKILNSKNHYENTAYGSVNKDEECKDHINPSECRENDSSILDS